MKSTENLARRVFSCPTAPYRENWVLEQIAAELNRIGIPYFEDKFGNLIAGARRPQQLKGRQRIGLIAHTDHPGFHLQSQVGKGLWKARWYGGAPQGDLRGAQVAIHNPRFPRRKLKGRITQAKAEGHDSRDVDWIWIALPKTKNHVIQKLQNKLGPDCFGAFDFPGFMKRGNRIFTRAADDLAGCVTILGTLERLKAHERKHFVGIFTRAEEVGFRGALGTLYSNTIPKSVLCISLEASRTLPGARLGKGPVIRLGDRRTLFDSQIIGALDTAALLLKKKNKSFLVQRRIMDGGTCEATPFNLYGRRCAGLAVPLGNYHNQGRDGRPAPEFIDLRDLERNVLLCVATVRYLTKTPKPFNDLDRALREGFRKDLKLLNKEISFNSRFIQGK